MSSKVEIFISGMILLCFDGDDGCPQKAAVGDPLENTAYFVNATDTSGEVCGWKPKYGHKPKLLYLRSDDRSGNPAACEPCSKFPHPPCPGNVANDYFCEIDLEEGEDLCLRTEEGDKTSPKYTNLVGRDDSINTPNPGPNNANSHRWLAHITHFDSRAERLNTDRLLLDAYTHSRLHFGHAKVESDYIFRESGGGTKEDYVVWQPVISDPETIESPTLPRALAHGVRAQIRSVDSTVSIRQCKKEGDSILELGPTEGDDVVELALYNHQDLERATWNARRSVTVNHFRWYYRLLCWGDHCGECPDDPVVPLGHAVVTELDEPAGQYYLLKKVTVFCPPASGGS